MKFVYRNREFTIDGFSNKDHIYKYIAKKSWFYESYLLEYMHAIIKRKALKNSVAIDVGANIGNHSLFIKSFITDQIISFEPNPDILPVLNKNLNQNIDNFLIFDCALGKTEGTGSIIIPDEADNNIGMARVNTEVKSDNNIKISTLDTVLSNIDKDNLAGNIELIKIDVEGMEIDVLKGATNTLKRCKPELFIEAFNQENFDALNNYLKKFDYKPLSRWSANPVYHFSHRPSLKYTLYVKLQSVLVRIRVKIDRQIKKIIRLIKK